MDIRCFIVPVFFLGHGISFLVCTVMLALLAFDVPISERVHKVASVIAIGPQLVSFVLLGAALAIRGFVA